MARSVRIGSREIGEGKPVYVVAEMSANHGGDYDTLTRMVRAAADAGADAVKLQTYTADTLTIESDRDCFRLSGGTPWDGRTLHELYREAATPWDWYPRIRELTDELGLGLFSTAFDATAVEYLESMDVPVHKVASFENIDIPLIETMARTGKPLIISTGTATLEEIGESVAAARAAGAKEIVLLKCTSAYPAPVEELNLRAIPLLASRFDVLAGVSDHTLGHHAAVAAVALGAVLVEKHLTLTRSVPGPDSAFSMEPDEFGEMTASIRETEAALGRAEWELTPKDRNGRKYRRSLFVVEDVHAGERLTAANVRSIRPGDGLPPKHLVEVLGKKATRDIARGTPLTWDLVRSDPST